MRTTRYEFNGYYETSDVNNLRSILDGIGIAVGSGKLDGDVESFPSKEVVGHWHVTVSPNDQAHLPTGSGGQGAKGDPK